MNGRFLLDTNIVIALLAKESIIQQHLKEDIEVINEFSKECIILFCDDSTAWYYGQIKSQLKILGKPIPENDIWISAVSVQHQIPLVTRDIHFKEIDKLTVIEW